MKIKGMKILVIAILIMTITAGCKLGTKDEAVKAPSGSEPLVEQETTIKTEVIADSTELEKLWQEYFYDAITTVCNARDFDSPEKINPVYIAQFCWYKYISEKGAGDLKFLNKDSTLRLFPLDIVLEYSKQYFNLTSLDLSKISENEYDAEKRAFIFGLPVQQDRPSYTNSNPWGIHLDKVTRNSDGTIIAVMASYDTYTNTNGRRTMNKNLVLKQREDSSLYFASGSWEYINNNLVTVTGNYKGFDKIQGFDGSMDAVSMVGEVEDKLILAYTPNNNESTALLMLVNTETLEVDKRLELEAKLDYDDVRQSGDKLVICCNDRIMNISKDLEKLEDIPLPKAITDKINRETKYDSNGNPDIFFGGYDISSDLTKLVYSDEIGLKLYNIKDNSEKLLSKSIEAVGDKLLKNYYHWMPRFVSGDKKTITSVLGYESIRNYTLCDLESGTSEVIDISSDGPIGVIRYDTGLIKVNNPIYNAETQTGENVTLYLDFKTGAITEVKLQDSGDTGYIVPDYYNYVGQNYGAFVTDKSDKNDYANNMFYINRLNLRTKLVEPKIISVKATMIHILGVLEDGRVLFWYNLNPSESGICITN